jgi:aminoglycoside phosphotransferase (APT) family kinase protein
MVDSMPVFARYDMRAQFETMRVVHEFTDVPVPMPYWPEDDPAVLGAPFFVMQRVDGLVPPDVLPYNWDSWVTQADARDRERLERSTVEVLAMLHALPDPGSHLPILGEPGDDAGAAMRTHIAGQRAYYEWAALGGPRSPLLEACLSYFETHPPVDPALAVLCWGDSRIGNIIYRDFRPVAVLDWEMACFGPPELDLGWLIFMHEFFQDIAANAGLDGLPDLLRRDAVAQAYTDSGGRSIGELDYYIFYAALRHAIIMFRIQSRAIAFGTATAPDEPDDMILHRKMLERMLATKETET